MILQEMTKCVSNIYMLIKTSQRKHKTGYEESNKNKCLKCKLLADFYFAIAIQSCRLKLLGLGLVLHPNSTSQNTLKDC